MMRIWKIKYYNSFNVNNPKNTCQHLLINYPAATSLSSSRTVQQFYRDEQTI